MVSKGKYIEIEPLDLRYASIGDDVRINNWRHGYKVTARSENFLYLRGKEFGNDHYSVIELRPSHSAYNDLLPEEEPMLTAGPDFWLFGWIEGEILDLQLFTQEWYSAYLKSWEDGETNFSRRAVAVRKAYIRKENKP